MRPPIVIEIYEFIDFLLYAFKVFFLVLDPAETFLSQGTIKRFNVRLFIFPVRPRGANPITVGAHFLIPFGLEFGTAVALHHLREFEI
jgi:hypothetical protein